MSRALVDRLGLEHWYYATNALNLSKEQYWYWQAVASQDPSGDHTEVMLDRAIKARIEDAFPAEFPRHRDVIAAFEAMLLAGEIARAYEYIRGPVHSFTTFSRIRCDHSSDYAHSKAHGVQLAKHAVRIAESVIDNENSVTVSYERNRDGATELITVQGSAAILQDLGLVT